MKGCDIICAIVIVGLWSLAWVKWLWDGGLRQVAVSLLPEDWNGSASPSEIREEMTSDALDTHLLTTFDGPGWLAKLLLCRFCAVNWISIAGTVAVSTVMPMPFSAAILVWAGGAGLAFSFRSFV